MRIIIYIFLFIAICACVNSSLKLRPTKFKCDLRHINLAILHPNIPKDTTFIIANIGKYPLIIQNVETSCGCTTPIWTKKPIKPGRSGEVKVTYDAKYPGRFHKTITVFANVEGGVVKLSISGEVEFNEQLTISGDE